MKRAANIFFAIAYLAMAIPMFYLPSQGFFLGSFGVEFKYLFGIGIILLSVIHFLITADLRRAVRCCQDAWFMAAPYLWTLLYSLVFWVVTMAGFRVMTRGGFYVIYQVIAVLVAAGTLYMFGSRGIYLMMTALTAALLLQAAKQVGIVGVGEFVRQYIRNIITFTGDSGSAMRAFEKIGYCYTTGFCLVYFLITMREKKSHILWAILSFFLFFLGLKRSVFFGIVGALVFYLLINRVKRPAKWVIPLSVAGLVGILAYIGLVYLGLFDWLENLGMTTSGRNWLYRQIRDFYYLSPAYLGKGAGFVATAFESGVFDVSAFGFAIGDIHNEYLRQYIEFGFWGFLVWLWLYTASRVKHFFHAGTDEADKRHGIVVFVLIMVNCIMFTTENSLYFYYTTIALSMLVMGYRHETFVIRTKLRGE